MKFYLTPNKDIYSLISAYECEKNEVLAIVDYNENLIGIYGRTEHEKIKQYIIKQYDISSIKIIDVINKNFYAIVQNRLADNHILNDFEKLGYRYIPIITCDNKFIYFEYNPRINNVESELFRKTALFFKNIDENNKKKAEELYCPICKNKIIGELSEKKITNCIFGGGKLVRYKCTSCGAIVGPLKMFELTEQELALDYKRHYTIFKEGDTTEDELCTFYYLKPKWGGKYLNYGCGGGWSKSIQILNEKGYDVYGFDPFSSNIISEKIITNRNLLSTMKFDGIFTNNLLEHLRNPVEELIFMKSLLRDQDAIMAHATPCYEYLYPYTRFHVCFPVNKSVYYMFNVAGFSVENVIKSWIHNDKYICMIVKQKG